MAITYTYTAPNSTGGFVVSNSITGNTYTSNAAGVISGVSPADSFALQQAGCTMVGAQPLANFRNLIDGGDFTTNPWQRGTTFSSGIANTLTYTADRFFAVGGASSAITVTQSSISLTSFQYGLQFGRTSSNSSAVAIWLGQVVESADSYRAQGQEVTLSFYAASGSGFSGSSGLSVLVNAGTGANQSASSMMASSWTGFTSIVNSSQAITSSFTRYQFTGLVPSSATQLGIQIGYTPSNVAAGSDFFIIAGVQLEIGGTASVFEHREIAYELETCQRYAWQINEPSSGVVVAAGTNTTSSAQQFFINNPVVMRVAPAVTVSSGSWKTQQGSSASSGTISSGTTHTIYGLTITCNTTGASSTGGTNLIGGGGTGWILASADF